MATAAAAAPAAKAAAVDPKLAFAAVKPPLRPSTLAAVEALGFTQMTPVQAATIPLFLSNKDVCVEAVTGSGKTLAFVLPLVEMILRRETPLKKHQVGAVIISPTRELAKQIFGVAAHFCQHAGLKPPLLLVGGTDVGDSFQTFSQDGADVLVATPGRLQDLLERFQAFDCRELEALVLDEADTLLSMGFSAALTAILGHLPKQRRTGLFSATQTREVRELARAGLRNPATVAVQVRDAATRAVQATPPSLRNFYAVVRRHEEKLALLLEFLKRHKDEKVMVFFITCAAVDYFAALLQRHPAFRAVLGLGGTTTTTNGTGTGTGGGGGGGGSSDAAAPTQQQPLLAALHGRMVQKKRDGMLQRFTQSQGGVLLCTDVAARGLDVPDVSWIVQYEPPQDPSFFIHRVGRTARAGRSGKSLTFLLEAEDPYVEFLRLKHVPLVPLAPPLALPATDPEGAAVLDACKALARADREVLEKGTRAYTAFVRAYKEHQCQFIFRFAQLDLAALARAYALLRLPKMPELVHHPLGPVDFAAFDEDTRGIAFKDKAREAARKRKVEEQRAEQARAKASRAAERREKGQEGGEQAVQRQGPQKPPEPPEQKRKKRKGRHQQIVEEWEELGREERLYKRLRQRKITQEEYEKELRRRPDGEGEGEGEGSSGGGGSDSDDSGGGEEGRRPSKGKGAEGGKGKEGKKPQPQRQQQQQQGRRGPKKQKGWQQRR